MIVSGFMQGRTGQGRAGRERMISLSFAAGHEGVWLKTCGFSVGRSSPGQSSLGWVGLGREPRFLLVLSCLTCWAVVGPLLLWWWEGKGKGKGVPCLEGELGELSQV